jgi:hypothetical protein
MNRAFNTLFTFYVLIVEFTGFSSSIFGQFETRKSSVVKNLGESIKLVCSDEVSEFRQWTWKRNKKELKSFENHRILTNELNELLISDLKKSDSGMYECTIDDRVVSSIQLTVIAIVQREYESFEDQYEKFLPLMLVVFSLTTSLVLFISLVKFISGKPLLENPETISKKHEETLTIENFVQLNLNKFEQLYNQIEKQYITDRMN